MNNFFLGLASIWNNIASTAVTLFHQPLVWAFAGGFAASTMVHLMVISDHPKRIPHILTKSPEKSYEHLNPKDPDHANFKSFYHFLLEYNRVRIVALSTLLIIILLLIMVLLNF